MQITNATIAAATGEERKLLERISALGRAARREMIAAENILTRAKNTPVTVYMLATGTPAIHVDMAKLLDTLTDLKIAIKSVVGDTTVEIENDDVPLSVLLAELQATYDECTRVAKGSKGAK